MQISLKKFLGHFFFFFKWYQNMSGCSTASLAIDELRMFGRERNIYSHQNMSGELLEDQFVLYLYQPQGLRNSFLPLDLKSIHPHKLAKMNLQK